MEIYFALPWIIETQIKDTYEVMLAESIVCSKLIRRISYSVESHLTFVDFLVLCSLMPLLYFEIISVWSENMLQI